MKTNTGTQTGVGGNLSTGQGGVGGSSSTEGGITTTQQAVEKTKERIENIIGHDLHCLYNLDEKDCDCGAISKVQALSSLIDEEKRGVAVDALSTMGRIDRAIGTSNKFIKTGGRREMVRNMREFAEKWIPLKALITNSQEK